MAKRSKNPKPSNRNSSKSQEAKSFSFRESNDGRFGIADPEVHIYGKKHPKVCSTNARGHKTPQDRSPLEIVVDASDGFIPLWAEGCTLRWRFNEPSMQIFQNPTLAKQGIRSLFGEALLQWGDSSPVKFTEANDNWDFEIAMSAADNCNVNGCTLARAFFPDAGRHDLLLFPVLFEQPHEEQVETMIHELGHVFGLRHFFAQVSETAFPSEIFGTHNKFSIMNYGEESVLTEDDKSDLKRLYDELWRGDLPEINGTPTVQFRPFHEALPGTMSEMGRVVKTKSVPHSSDRTEEAMRELLIQLLETS